MANSNSPTTTSRFPCLRPTDVKDHGGELASKPNAVTKTQHPDLPFVTSIYTKRGALIADDHFDIPPSDGWSSNGLIAFRDLMSFAKANPHSGVTVRAVIIAAARDIDDPIADGKSKRFEAGSFLNQVSRALEFFARHANWQEVSAAEIADAEAWRARVIAEEKEKNLATGKRLAAARAAKRTAREASPAH